MTLQKWIGIHTGGAHYLDHLGVLCILLKIPLILTDYDTFLISQQLYPNLDVKYVEFENLSLKIIADQFDVIFESGHYWAYDLLPIFEAFFNKKMRIVYCPHGNSDKGYTKKSSSPKDISFVYGNHMIDHLKATKDLDLISEYIVTGNYRSLYYQQNQSFYDSHLQSLLGSQLYPRRKTILYAPTWSDGESVSSFEPYCERIIKEIGLFYNVIIKWHPFIEETHQTQVEALLNQYEGVKGVVFLKNFPAIYPILSISDFYLGDFSSIGYDFLFFNRPLFFLKSHHGLLYDCGTVLSLDQHFGESIRSYIDNSNMQNKRLKLYEYVFEADINKNDILYYLKKALNKTKKESITKPTKS